MRGHIFPMSNPFHPPLGPRAQAARDHLPDGESILLSICAVVCNSLHRHAGPARAIDCSRCRHAPECTRQVEDALAYVAALPSRASSSPSSPPRG